MNPKEKYLKIAQMLTKGDTYDNIAKELHVSKSTISTVQRIKNKGETPGEEISKEIKRKRTSKDETVNGAESREHIKINDLVPLDKSDDSYQPLVVSSISGLSLDFISKEDITSLIEVYSLLQKMHVKKEKVKNYLNIILKLAKYSSDIGSS